MRVVTPGTIGTRQILFAAAAVIVVIWFLTGGPFYIVGPEEQGVILTFGKLTSINGPGFHLKLPWPVQAVIKLR
jgi:membrane protease subunit HflK